MADKNQYISTLDITQRWVEFTSGYHARLFGSIIYSSTGGEGGSTALPIRTDPTGATSQPVIVKSSTGGEGGSTALPIRVDPTGATNQPVTIKSSTGGEGGSTALPVRVDPTGATKQPVIIYSSTGGEGGSTALPLHVTGSVTSSTAVGAVIYSSTGGEGGSTALPLRTDPTGATSQPVVIKSSTGGEGGSTALPIRVDPVGATKQPVIIQTSTGGEGGSTAYPIRTDPIGNTTQPVSIATAPALVASTAIVGAARDAGPIWTDVRYRAYSTAASTALVDLTTGPATTALYNIVTDLFVGMTTAVGDVNLYDSATTGTPIHTLIGVATPTNGQFTSRGILKLAAGSKLQALAAAGGIIAFMSLSHDEAS